MGKTIKVAVSACLLGAKCRYDGLSNLSEPLLRLFRKHNVQAVPVCPEVLGGLPVPRECSERLGDRVLARSGLDVSSQFAIGAEKALQTVLGSGCAFAVLKARSPSCGRGRIYDGTFSHVQVAGDGVFAELLGRHGMEILTEEEVRAVKKMLKSLS